MRPAAAHPHANQETKKKSGAALRHGYNSSANAKRTNTLPFRLSSFHKLSLSLSVSLTHCRSRLNAMDQRLPSLLPASSSPSLSQSKKKKRKTTQREREKEREITFRKRARAFETSCLGRDVVARNLFADGRDYPRTHFISSRTSFYTIPEEIFPFVLFFSVGAQTASREKEGERGRRSNKKKKERKTLCGNQ